MSTIVKITNDINNVIKIHNEIFSPEVMDKLNGDKTIFLYDLGNPLHYILLRRNFPNLKIYGIEDRKLDVTFRYCINELDCKIEFYKNANDKCELIKYIKNHINKSKQMKFDITAGNPPFDGKGKPLFMDVIKTIYENHLSEDGIMRMIHPTTLVDNKFNLTLYDEYSDLKVISFEFSNELRDIFNGANIGNGIGIFTYGKSGKNSLFDDELKSIRYGEVYYKDKEIVEKILSKNQGDTIGNYHKYKYLGGDKNKKNTIDELNSKHNIFVSFARNRGHIDGKTFGLKWDWTSLQSEDYLKVLNKLEDIGQSVLLVNSKEEAIKYIKWSVTDVVNYIVLFFKNNVSNNRILFKHIPQPIPSGDFSDESIMKHFGLSKEQMEHIHNKVKKYGWKVHYNCSEEDILKKIEEINS